MKQHCWLFVILIFHLKRTSASEGPAGQPLFLSPLIEAGKIDEARKLALVDHEDLRSVESYSGYLTVNKTYNSNTFFWYFPAKEGSKTAPLLLWLNGGPGSTSLFGLFNENGPFIVNDDQVVENRKYSWHLNRNVIYIDNPVGTGFSFTGSELGYARTSGHYGSALLLALLQFFKLFPELRSNDFYLTGESYAGKYIPAAARAIQLYNKNAESKINLKGLFIGNGYTDPINQLVQTDFLYQLGLIDENERAELTGGIIKVKSLIGRGKYLEAAMLFESLASLSSGSETVVKNMTGFDYYYHLLLANGPKSFLNFVGWVQKTDVRRALHVGNTPFLENSPTVQRYLAEDFMQSVAHLIPALLQDYKVLIFSGHLDISVPFTGTHNYLLKLNWPGAKNFKVAKRRKWMVDGELAGYVRSAGNLDEVLVRNAGHLVPHDQPKWAFDLITRFTHNKNLLI